MRLSEKRYFKVEYDEEWYLFDSTTISEQLVKEQAEYGYGVFVNSLSPSEICDRLNNLHQENQELKHYKLYEDNKRLQTIIADLKEENEQLRQILKDIVMATDETYTKNRSVYKVSVIFDNETYLKIRECLNE